jgi:hypothetical protein
MENGKKWIDDIGLYFCRFWYNIFTYSILIPNEVTKNLIDIWLGDIRMV